jgi:hypothetical protein
MWLGAADMRPLQEICPAQGALKARSAEA